MKSNLENRLKKIENALEDIVNPLANNVTIFVLKDKGETLEENIAEKENELKKKINRNTMISINVRGLNRI